MNTHLLDPQTTGIEITEHGLVIRRHLSVDDWRDLMKKTRRVHSLYHSVLSDLTGYGRRVYGDEVVNDALEQLEFDLADATRAECIGLVGYDRRAKYNLSSEQAYIIGSMLTEDADREKWAQICAEEELTALELKKSIEAGTVMRESDIRSQSGHNEGIASAHAVRFQFERWQRQIKDPEAVIKLPKPERMKLLDVFKPIIEFAALIEKSLN